MTQADRVAEQTARSIIQRAFPGDGILGEEFGEIPGATDFQWVVDPIDGTKSFICGVPLYTTLVGVLYRQEPVVGVIHAPALDEMVYAAQEHGAWYLSGGNAPQRIQVSHCDRLRDARFVTSQVSSFFSRGRGDAYRQLEEQAAVTRTWGDGYGYLLVATGRADVMVDPVMEIWDAAAVAPVVREAGGVFTDWQGKRTIRNREGVAANAALLDQVLPILQGPSRE